VLTIVDQLTANLLDLLFELEGRKIPLMVGGGYGLYLKRRHLAATGARTLLDSLPAERATNDLDMFLRAELLSNLHRTREFRDAILRLGYKPVEEAKFLQWKKKIDVAGVQQEVKIDVLVGPLGRFRTKLKRSLPRVRPKGDIQFHAHAVEEAISLEDQPITVEVRGARSNGDLYRGNVEVPEAFPYLMMKLHAFADRKDDDNKDLGRHHALDAYAIVGMMTEPEYERARQIGAERARDLSVERARAIVREDFSQDTATGILRIREHRLFKPEFQLGEFRQVLREVFQTSEEVGQL
jgi:hypothetical protein